MFSQLVHTGGRWTLEVELPTTGIDRVEAAREALKVNGLEPGQVSIEFVNPSTSGKPEI